MWKIAIEVVGKENSKESRWENELAMYEVDPFFVNSPLDSWYRDIRYYLYIINIPTGLDAQKHIYLCLKSSRYQLIFGFLFRRNFDNVLL